MDLTTRTVLNLCRDIETICAEIYFLHAETFAENRQLHKLWIKTANEELNHANIVELALKCSDMKSADKSYDVFNYRNQKKILEEILFNLKKVKISPTEALRSAINLEKKLAQFHIDCVIDFKNKEEELFFTQLLEGDKHHLKRLEDAYHSFVKSERNK